MHVFLLAINIIAVVGVILVLVLGLVFNAAWWVIVVDIAIGVYVSYGAWVAFQMTRRN